MLPYQVECLVWAPLALVNGSYTDKLVVCHSGHCSSQSITVSLMGKLLWTLGALVNLEINRNQVAMSAAYICLRFGTSSADQAVC